MGQITIRLPDEIEAQIREKAASDRRSMNGEILWLLERALTQQGES